MIRYSLRSLRAGKIERDVEYRHGLDAEIDMRRQMDLWNPTSSWDTIEIFDYKERCVVERWTPNGSVWTGEGFCN